MAHWSLIPSLFEPEEIAKRTGKPAVWDMRTQRGHDEVVGMPMSNESTTGTHTPRPGRKAIPRAVQVQVFRRDRWLCCWCHRPVIFAPAMKLLTHYMRQAGHQGPLAYYDERSRRDAAPLLDGLWAVIDHIVPYSKGGPHGPEAEHFATACNKCNMRKGDRASSVMPPPRRIKAKYGEPKHWDGFSELFLVLARQFPSLLTATDRDWQKALRKGQLG